MKLCLYLRIGVGIGGLPEDSSKQAPAPRRPAANRQRQAQAKQAEKGDWKKGRKGDGRRKRKGEEVEGGGGGGGAGEGRGPRRGREVLPPRPSASRTNKPALCLDKIRKCRSADWKVSDIRKCRKRRRLLGGFFFLL
jgi:hypothetical protein